MAPIVDGLGAEWKDRVEFVYVNVADANTRDLRTRLGFDATPHFFFLDSIGAVQSTAQGVLTRDSLVAHLQRVAGERP